MKRNSIFMWAYITFVFMAIIMRLCFDYPLWTPLVLAVTFSSVLFAVEDLFASLAKALSDTCDNKENFVSIAREKAEKTLAYYEKIGNHIHHFENLDSNVYAMEKTVEKNKSQLTEMIKVCSDIEREARVDRFTQKQYLQLVNACAYLGFISLFCTLIIAPFIVMPDTVQEVITACSFLVILITRQISIDKSMKIKDDMIKYQNIIRRHEDLEANISSTEKDFSALSKLIDIPVNYSEEVSSHAD